MSALKHSPALALPWRVLPKLVSKETTPRVASDSGGVALMLTCRFLGEKSPSAAEKRNAAYIVHAANAYPRLIEAIREDLRGYLGDFPPNHAATRMRAILRELGEAE